MSKAINNLPIMLQKAKEVTVIELRNTLSNFDLSEQQWRVISATAEHGELNAQTLAEESAILGPSLSRILNRLETDGLLTRKVSPGDQRELIIGLSAKGKRLYKRVSPKVESSFDGLAKKIGAGKAKQLSDLLEHVIGLEV